MPILSSPEQSQELASESVESVESEQTSEAANVAVPPQRNSDVARTAENTRAQRAGLRSPAIGGAEPAIDAGTKTESETETESESENEPGNEDASELPDYPVQRSNGVEVQPFKVSRFGLEFSGKTALTAKRKTDAIGGVRSKVDRKIKLSPGKQGELLAAPMQSMVAAARSFDTGVALPGWESTNIDFELLGVESDLSNLDETKVKFITAGATFKKDAPVVIGNTEYELTASIKVSLTSDMVATLLKERGPQLAARSTKQLERMSEIMVEISKVKELIKQQETTALLMKKLPYALPKAAFDPKDLEKFNELRKQLESAYARTQSRLAKLGQHFRNSQVGGQLRKFLTKNLAPIAKGSAKVLKIVSKFVAWPLLIIDALDASYLLISWARGEAVMWPFQSRLPGSEEGDNAILPSFTNTNVKGTHIDGTERFSDASPALTRLFTNMTGPSNDPTGKIAVDAAYLERFFDIADRYPMTDEKVDAINALTSEGGTGGGDSLDALEKLAQLTTEELQALAPREGETLVSTAGLTAEQLKELAAKRGAKKPDADKEPTDEKDAADDSPDLSTYSEDEQKRIRRATPLFSVGLTLTLAQKQRLADLLAAKMTEEKLSLFEKYPSLRRVPFTAEEGFKRLEEVLSMSLAEIEKIAKAGKGYGGNGSGADETGVSDDEGGTGGGNDKVKLPGDTITVGLTTGKDGESVGGGDSKTAGKEGDGTGAGTGKVPDKEGDGSGKRTGSGSGDKEGAAMKVSPAVGEFDDGETEITFLPPRFVNVDKLNIGGSMNITVKVASYPEPNTTVMKATLLSVKKDASGVATLEIRMNNAGAVALHSSDGKQKVRLKAREVFFVQYGPSTK